MGIHRHMRDLPVSAGSSTLADERPDAAPGSLAACGRAFAYHIEAITLFSYFARDLTTGAMRYYLALVGLGPLWFVPDILAGLCLIVFIQRYIVRGNSAVALLTLLYLALSLFIGYSVLGSAAAAASAFKMILPVIAGFCFCGRAIGSYRRLLGAIHAFYYVAVVGVLLSSTQPMPWDGFQVESFGSVRDASRIWWSGDGERRLSGFAGDSTMAAFFILITFAITAPRQSLRWSLIVAPIGIYAAYISTSKTGFGGMVLYLAALIAVRMVPMARRFAAIRRLSLASFWVIAIPVILIVLLNGVDLESINPILFSLQDRINNSWQLPFVSMLRMAPTGYLTGCGLGCFNYPHMLFAPQLADFWVPIDNFYLGTYLMLGFPFFVFLYFAIRNLAQSDDPYRHALAFTMNVFTVTVLCYGPSSGLLVFGIVFSDAFKAVRQGQSATDAPEVGAAPSPAHAVPARA